MGDGTVSNHDTIIATKGTPHVAKAKPSTADWCKDAGGKPVIHGDNQINSYNLSKGKTTKTVIAGAPIWTEKGWLDEIPSWPAHGGVLGGVNVPAAAKGLNYIQYAYATSWSTDVKIEGGGVVRTDDTTKQNGGNCDGYVDGSNLKNWNDATTDAMKKKCTIKKVTGKCAHGRELGAPPNADKGADGFFLDVVCGAGKDAEVVSLEAERKDVTVPSKETTPTCGLHTYWIASRTGTDGKKATLDKINDKFDVKGDVLANPMPELESKFSVGESAGKDGLTAAKKGLAQGVDNTLTAHEVTAGGSTNVVVSRTSEKSKSKAEWDDSKEAIAGAVNMVKLLDQLRQQWAIEKKPPVVNVTAVACSGAKNVKLRVFPKGAVKYEMPAKWLQEKLDRLHRIGATFTAATTKIKIETEFCFLQGLKFEFEIEFKELTENKNNRFKTEVHRAWKLDLKCEKVIYLRAKDKLGLLTLVNSVFPGAGTVLDCLANLAGIEVNGFLEVELTLSMSVGGGIDEYDEGSLDGTKAELVGVIKLGLEAKYSGKAGLFRAWAELTVTNTLAAENFGRSKNVDMWLKFDVTGSVKLGADCGYTADLFNWNAVSRATIGVSVSDKKEWEFCKFPAGDGPLGTFDIPPP